MNIKVQTLNFQWFKDQKWFKRRDECKRAQRKRNLLSSNEQINKWKQVYRWMRWINSCNSTISVFLNIYFLYLKFILQSQLN